MRIMVLIVLLILPASIVFAEVPTDPFGFREEDYSSWGIIDAPYPYTGVDAEGNEIGYGCFPVGNGQVFAHLGVDGDFNTLRGITGPGYQTRDDESKAVYWQEGEWPDMRISLNYVNVISAGEAISWREAVHDRQSICTARGTAIVRITQSSEDSGTLYSLTYAVPGRPILIREFCWLPPESLEHSWANGSWLEIALPKAKPVWSRELHLSEPRYLLAMISQGQNRCLLTAPGRLHNMNGSPGSDGSEWHLSGKATSYAGRPAVHYAMACVYYREGQPIPEINQFALYSPQGGIKGLLARQLNVEVDELANLIAENPDCDWPPFEEPYRKQAYDYWQAWSSQNMSFDTGDQRLDDMMTQLPVIIETQRDAYSGGVAPMVSYHGYWVRDSMGPMLMYMANRRFDEVKRMLRYHRAASLHYGHCHMQVPLDLDLSHLPGWALGEPGSAGDLAAIGRDAADWEGVGVEHAEVPSLIVLEHYLLWREMHSSGYGDDADTFIREAWPFIAHNLFSMDFDPTYGVKFHGDETYAHGALYSTYDRAESGQIGYPNGYIPTDFFSFDNTILHRAAASAAEELATSLGDVEAQAQACSLREQLDAITNEQYHVKAHNWSVPYASAISPLTKQRWHPPFSNILLRPYWLGLDYGVLDDMDTSLSHMEHVLELWHSPYPRTTPWSGYMTGHSLGYWLGATSSWGSQHQAQDAVHLLLRSASPEGAWCEVLDPEGMPVDIYGRTNRIRPWESGINYFSLANYCLYQCLYHEHQAYFSGRLSGGYPQSFDARAVVLHGLKSLVITKSDDWRERVKRHPRLGILEEEQITVWDAGFPFSVADLEALFTHQGFTDSLDYGARNGIAVLYLYFDRGVRGGLDRRTFKDEEFWYGEEMTNLLADYEAAGGTVIDADATDLSQDE